jgi:hypothetical protein
MAESPLSITGSRRGSLAGSAAYSLRQSKLAAGGPAKQPLQARGTNRTMAGSSSSSSSSSSSAQQRPPRGKAAVAPANLGAMASSRMARPARMYDGLAQDDDDDERSEYGASVADEDFLDDDDDEDVDVDDDGDDDDDDDDDDASVFTDEEDGDDGDCEDDGDDDDDDDDDDEDGGSAAPGRMASSSSSSSSSSPAKRAASAAPASSSSGTSGATAAASSSSSSSSSHAAVAARLRKDYGPGEKEKVTLLVPSMFAHRPATAWFDYSPEFHKDVPARAVDAQKLFAFRPRKASRLLFRQTTAAHCIHQSLRRAGFAKLNKGASFNFMWTGHCDPKRLARLEPYQKVVTTPPLAPTRLTTAFSSAFSFFLSFCCLLTHTTPPPPPHSSTCER